MNNLPQRKHVRLKNYDYGDNGAYFITFCIKDRHELLGALVVGNGVLDVPKVELSELGEIVEKQIIELDNHYDHVDINKYIIMPNHVHMIVIVKDQKSGVSGTQSGVSGTPHPTNAVIPSLLSTLKRFTNKRIGYSIWQSSYHDHIIRDELDYQNHWQYIDENPAKWAADKYYEG